MTSGSTTTGTPNRILGWSPASSTMQRRCSPTCSIGLGSDWDRTVVYNYPSHSVRSLRWVAVHTVHELQHHLLDVRRQLR